MVLEVRLFATFRQERFKVRQMELPEGISLAGLLEMLVIDIKEVGILLVNGRNSNEDMILNAGDIVAIFPVVGGG